MRLSDETYEEIKRTVIDTFVEYDINCIPINGFEMATKMGIRVIPYSALDEQKGNIALKISNDGFSLEVPRVGWTIYYNDCQTNYGRINQTIMHEIGHYAMGHNDKSDAEEAEAEANFFAKYALAPPVLIQKVCEKVTAQEIMKKFDISYQAAWYAVRYYRTWLRHGNNTYTNYEQRMLMQFKIA